MFAINIPLLLSLPHSISAQHCCQSGMDIASRNPDLERKVSFARAALAGFNLRWVFQLPKEEVSSKLAVILPIQLLGLKWEFKVNFMQI